MPARFRDLFYGCLTVLAFRTRCYIIYNADSGTYLRAGWALDSLSFAGSKYLSIGAGRTRETRDAQGGVNDVPIPHSVGSFLRR